MDFGILPPEVNSARMYAGPGSGSLLAAAASWDSLSAELSITGAVYESVLGGLRTSYWHGPASHAMAVSAAPYVQWLHATAERAQHTAIQARAAAAAYELAHAMTVPPPAVAANRTQLALLIATNFFGQNTPAIAATEAQYAEYWAQDASAMYSYASSSAAAVQFSPFSSPRQTTNPEGLTAQKAAVVQANTNASGSGTSSGTQALSSTPGASGIPLDLRVLDVIQGVSTSFGAFRFTEGVPQGIIGAEKDLGLLPTLTTVPAALPKAPQLSGAASGMGNVNAILARAGRIGSLSVPAGWAASSGNPVTAPLGSGLSPLAATEEITRTGSVAPGLPGVPGGRMSRAALVVPRYGVRITVMTRPPAAG